MRKGTGRPIPRQVARADVEQFVTVPQPRHDDGDALLGEHVADDPDIE